MSDLAPHADSPRRPALDAPLTPIAPPPRIASPRTRWILFDKLLGQPLLCSDIISARAHRYCLRRKRQFVPASHPPSRQLTAVVMRSQVHSQHDEASSFCISDRCAHRSLAVRSRRSRSGTYILSSAMALCHCQLLRNICSHSHNAIDSGGFFFCACAFGSELGQTVGASAGK